jgi:hypothetical protein
MAVTGNINDTLNLNYTANGFNQQNANTVNGDKAISIDVNIAAAASGQEIDIGFTIAEVVGCDLVANAAITITPYATTNAGTPIALTATAGSLYVKNTVGTNPFIIGGQTLISKLLVSSTPGGRVQGRIVLASAT